MMGSDNNEERKASNASAAGRTFKRWEPVIVRSSYVFIHLLIYFVLMFRNGTDLNIAMVSGTDRASKDNIIYLVWTHCIFLTTFITYYRCCRASPGFIGNTTEHDVTIEQIESSKLTLTYNNNNQMELSTTNITSTRTNQNNNNNILVSTSLISNTTTIRNNNNNNESLKYSDDEGSSNNNEIDKLLDQQEDKEDNNSSVNIDYKQYCKICNHFTPIRAKHCKRCDKCILKYDHHCYFIGKCVGHNNHKHFFTFLIAQAVLLILGFQIALTGFKSENSIVEWAKENVFILWATMIIFATMCMPLALLIYHSYLIMTNQTSWESTKKEKITYLSKLTVSKPFHKGSAWKNIVSYWNDNDGILRWDLPTPKQMREMKKQRSKSFNIWKNKYYSCC